MNLMCSTRLKIAFLIIQEKLGENYAGDAASVTVDATQRYIVLGIYREGGTHAPYTSYDDEIALDDGS